MKNVLFIFYASFLVSCTTPATNPVVVTQEDEDKVKEIQSSLLPKAYDEQDTVLLNQLLHEDFQLIDDNGDSYSKIDELEYVGQYGPSYTEFNYDITDLKLFERGTAVVRGTGTMKGTEDGEAYITTYKNSSTFIKVGADWKVVNSHVSGVKEERFEAVPN